MKHIGLLIVAMVAGSVLAGCASQPTQTTEAPPPAATPVASAPVPAPTPVPAPAPTASSIPVAAAEAAPAPEAARKVPGGYRLIKRNGKELYCKSVTTIGTRFAEQMCFTREQIDEIDERTNHAMDDFEQARKTCSGGPYCVEM